MKKNLKKSDVQQIDCKRCRDLWPMSKCKEHDSAPDPVVSEQKQKLIEAWEKVLNSAKIQTERHN